jgi:hypothetical protein
MSSKLASSKLLRLVFSKLLKLRSSGYESPCSEALKLTSSKLLKLASSKLLKLRSSEYEFSFT